MNPVLGGILFLLALVTFLPAQTATFSATGLAAPPNGDIRAEADLNRDGRLDIVTATTQSPYKLTVLLANSDGSFTVSQEISLPDVAIVALTEDFNRDGCADLLITLGGAAGHGFAKGNCDGTFGAYTPTAVGGLATADFNGDGKLDVVTTGTSGGIKTVVWAAGKGDGTFSTTRHQIYTMSNATALVDCAVIGDFDGDGHADIAVAEDQGVATGSPTSTRIAVMYGDGAGHFSAPHTMTIDGAWTFVSADLNKNGKSDLVGTFIYGAGTPRAGVHILYGSASRTMSEKTLALAGARFSETFSAAVADYNADGKQDIAVGNKDSSGWNVAVFYQSSSGTFGTPRTLPVRGTGLIGGMLAGDYNHDRKPDIGAYQEEGTLDLLKNTSSSTSFPTCFAPGKPGVHVCTPGAGAIVSSPLTVNTAASMYSPLRDLQIAVDGSKKAEGFNSYADYSFLTSSLTLTPGSHQITAMSSAYDARRQNASLTVCVRPSTATGTVVCSPSNGSTVGSSVTLRAAGGLSVPNMEIWVDGVRKATAAKNSISTTLTLSAGSHTMKAVSTSGTTTLSSATSTFTVK